MGESRGPSLPKLFPGRNDFRLLMGKSSFFCYFMHAILKAFMDYLGRDLITIVTYNIINFSAEDVHDSTKLNETEN